MSKDSKKRRRYIKEQYLQKSDEELAAHLGIARQEVKQILEKLGLNREKAKLKAQPLKFSPKVRLLFLAFVILMGILLYNNTFNNQFVWDDYFLIVDNLYIREVKFLPQIFTTDLHRFGSVRSNFYRPLQNLSFMLDYSLGKFAVWPYHLSSLLLHLTTSILIYFLILRLAQNEIIAFLTAFIFVAHPVQTETVTYLSDRADLLASVFIFGGFLAFLDYYEKPKLWLLVILNVCFLSALLSKELALIFPLIILLWVNFFAGLKEKADLKPVYASILSIGGIYILLRLTLLHFPTENVLAENEVLPIRVLTMLKALWRYFVLLVFPQALHMERNFPWVRSLAEPAVWAGILIIAGSIFWAGRKYRRERYPAFAVAFFYLSLFPVLNIFPVNAIMSEHWLYLPSFSFALIMAWIFFRLFQYRSLLLKAAFTLLLSANFSFYAYRTITRNAEWKDEETLYQATLRYQPNSARVYYNLGNVYALRNDYPQAIEKYLQALKFQPDYPEAWSNLGLAYYRLGKIDLAITQYHQALEYEPDLASAHNNLALALDRKGRSEEAKAEYEKALERNPDYAEPHNGLGIYYAQKKQWDKAIFHFQQALRLKPDFSDASNNLKRAQLLRQTE